MQKILISLFVSYCLIACSSNTNNNQTADVQPANDSAAAVSSACYVYMQNKDTIHLNITIRGDMFSGHMLYQLRERDRNDGTLQGTIKGDTLVADYTFSSEGMTSVRQVAFLKQGNNLKEGFGEVEERNGRMIFANPQTLQFTGFVLTPAACE